MAEQRVVDAADKVVLVQFSGVPDAQFLSQRQKQRIGIKVGVGQIGRHPAVVQGLQQAATEQGLAGADFARDLDETLTVGERQQACIERLLMILDEVSEAGLRRDAEGQLGQTKVFQIQRPLRLFAGTRLRARRLRQTRVELLHAVLRLEEVFLPARFVADDRRLDQDDQFAFLQVAIASAEQHTPT